MWVLGGGGGGGDGFGGVCAAWKRGGEFACGDAGESVGELYGLMGFWGMWG